MKHKLHILIALTLAASVTKNKCADEKPWYTPYVNSAKSWWNTNITPQHTPPLSFKDRLHNLAERIDDARERLAFKGLTHSEDVSYLDPENVPRLKKERDARELRKVVRKYSPSPEIIQTIEAHGPYETGEKYFIKGKENLPSIYYKGQFLERLAYAKRLENLIQQEGLDDLLYIPKKYVYQTKDGLRIFAEPIIPGKQTPLTLEEVKRISPFMQKSGYWDFHAEQDAPNWIRTKDGRIALIDTEHAGFDVNRSYLPSPWDIFLPDRRLLSNPMEDRAKQWVEKQSKKADKKIIQEKPIRWGSNEYKEAERKKIPYNQQYDPEGIKFKRALRATDPWYQYKYKHE